MRYGNGERREYARSKVITAGRNRNLCERRKPQVRTGREEGLSVSNS